MIILSVFIITVRIMRITVQVIIAPLSVLVLTPEPFPLLQLGEANVVLQPLLEVVIGDLVVALNFEPVLPVDVLLPDVIVGHGLHPAVLDGPPVGQFAVDGDGDLDLPGVLDHVIFVDFIVFDFYG